MLGAIEATLIGGTAAFIAYLVRVGWRELGEIEKLNK